MSKAVAPVMLIAILATTPCLALAQQSKLDTQLQAFLATSNPSDLVGIIIVFTGNPTEEQISALRTVHSMEITYVYRIIPALAGKAPAEEIPKVAQYDWVKEIWLDRSIYATPSNTVEISNLIRSLQQENEELNQTISVLNQRINELQKQNEAQQGRISQLGTDMRIYPIATFAAGLVIGAAAGILLVKTRPRKQRTG